MLHSFTNFCICMQLMQHASTRTVAVGDVCKDSADNALLSTSKQQAAHLPFSQHMVPVGTAALKEVPAGYVLISMQLSKSKMPQLTAVNGLDCSNQLP